MNLTGSELPRGSDLRCRWSRDGTEREDTLPGGEVNASRNGDAGGSLQCSSPSAAAGTSAVAVSPNAQQFSPHTRDFYFYEPPVVSGSSPTTGSAGATVVVVHGSRLKPTTTCDVVCKFGETVVAGVAIDVDGAGAIRCEAPPAAVSSEGALMPLEVSLNRQQYSTGSATFTRYAALANLTAVLPGSGPTTGGTDIVVSGELLGGGDDYRRRFSGATGRVTVVASYNATDGTVVCTTPDLTAAGSGDAAVVVWSGTHGAGEYIVSVSLNRQQYFGAIPYRFYEPGAPTTASPASGPVRGDTLVTVSGTGLADGTNYTCRYLLAANLSSEVFDLDNYAFSVAQSNGSVPTMLTPATYDGGDLKCVSPPAAAAGLRKLVVAHNAQQYATPPLDFEYYDFAPVAADGAPGLALSPTTGATGGGTTVTLTEAVLTSTDACMYADDGVCDEPWTCAANTDCTDCTAAEGTTCGVRAGTDRRCRFGSCDGTDCTVAATVVATKSGSLSASELICESPAAPDGVAVEAVEVTLNGQQYSRAAAIFAYFAPPEVSSILPESGPVAGGTQLTFAGANLVNGSDYRCIFWDDDAKTDDDMVGYVHASYDAPTASVRCVAPAALPAGLLPLSVRLNGQQDAASDLKFRVHAPPRLLGVSPSSGPRHGNTSVVLTGDGFDSASARGVSRCGFGAAEDVAAFPDGTSSMSCATPNATLAGLASTLVVDFTSEELLEPLVEDDALEGLNVVTGELDALRRDNAVRDLASGGKLLAARG